MSLLSFENLTIGYENNPVVENLSFSIDQGDYLAILGENGAGKSTLLKTMLGLIKPLHGSIVFGQEVKKTEIGYLPQQTVVQRDFPASVWEIVISGCLAKNGLRPFYCNALSGCYRQGYPCKPYSARIFQPQWRF